MRPYRTVTLTADDAPGLPSADNSVSAYDAALNCLLGGAGMAAMLASGCFAFGAWQTGLTAAALGGLAFAGLLATWHVLRPVVDVEWQLWQGRRAERRIAELEAQLATTIQQRDAANDSARAWRDQYDRLDRERHRRAAPTFVSPQAPPDDPVQRDAFTLLVRRYRRNEPVSKEYMISMGWSAERYLAATRYLRGLGYFVGNQWRAFGSEQDALRHFSPAAPSDQPNATRG
jgi:hypothetical protein